jgi:hypothetical protein
MPQVKEPLIRRLIKKAINEAELTVGDSNTTFSIKVDVSNPQSETKLGVRIQLKPKSEDFLFADPDKKGALSVAIMKKLNNSLGQFDIQVSKDTDAETVDPTVLGFFIPLSQIKNMIVKSLGGKSENQPSPPTQPSPSDIKRSAPKANIGSLNKLKAMGDDEDEELTEQDLSNMSRTTGQGMKNYRVSQETTGGIPELYEKVNILSELIIEVFKEINDSDFDFKNYYTKNEESINKTASIISIIKDELEDRLEKDEPVDEKGIEELKKVIKNLVKEQLKPLNEMRVRDLNEISKVVVKEDFYNFINAGNNVLRTLEENGISNGKKYLGYLVKHNIM